MKSLILIILIVSILLVCYFADVLFKFSLYMKENCIQRLPWQSSGYGFMLPMQRVWVRSLGGELRSHMQHGQKNIIKRIVFIFEYIYNSHNLKCQWYIEGYTVTLLDLVSSQPVPSPQNKQ